MSDARRVVRIGEASVQSAKKRSPSLVGEGGGDGSYVERSEETDVAWRAEGERQDVTRADEACSLGCAAPRSRTC
jgi:hypothetical protein